MTRVVISQPMYFPWAGFLAQMALADVFIWLDDARFSKGSFTNRVQMLVGGTRKWMTIPLAGKGSHSTIADLAAPTEDWRDSHLSLIRTALGERAAYGDARDCAAAALAPAPLCQTIIASAEALAGRLGVLPPRILISSQLDCPGTGWRRVLDLVVAVGGREYITGHGARNYLDHSAFEARGIDVSYMNYAPRAWPQPGGEFMPHVSGLDLLATVGAAAAAEHLNPATLPWRRFLQGAG